MRHFVFLIAIFASLIPDLRADEPFFKPNDVVALVGGEDMVVAAELGYLETLIQLALPDHHLKFRSLAREGDTVFEQRRDLNYPKLEDQLDKIGATVVICQFGQMESLMAARAVEGMHRLDATDKVDASSPDSAVQDVHKIQAVQEKADAAVNAKIAEFVAAYEKLIGRLKGKDGGRRVAIAAPMFLNEFFWNPYLRTPESYESALDRRSEIEKFSKKIGILYLNSLPSNFGLTKSLPAYRGFDMKTVAHRWWASDAARDLANVKEGVTELGYPPYSEPPQPKLTALVAAKNRIWYHYYRPQNWAFLAGDRTNQPSSRDHLDPSKRWFPEELEKFVPLIDAKDAEIWALAKKLQ